MSTTTPKFELPAHPVITLPAPLPKPAGRERRALTRGRPALIEGTILFALSFAVFAALGIWLTVHLKVVAFDGAYRLTHAYLAWYGAPAKLAAIGFVWPPVMTIVFMPLALIKPLVTSLVALPLTSAVFAAGTLVVLNRLLEHCGLPRLARYPLLVAFAANPMFVHYATNGMSEMLAFFWLVLGFYEFLRWERTNQSAYLALSGAALAFGVLSRYELLPYAAVIGAGMLAIAISRWRTRPKVIESSILLFAAPIVYALMTWMLFNWIVIGDPLNFLHNEIVERFVLEKGRAVAQGGAAGVSVSNLFDLAGRLFSLYWRLFAPQVLVLVPLVILSIRRRSAIGWTLVALILLNPLMTAIFVKASDQSLLQLRFNMRSMPLVVIAVGWMFEALRGRTRHRILVLAAVGAFVACIPLTWQTMKTYPYVFADRDFVHALQSLKPNDTAGIGDAQRMSAYINQHVHGVRQVLVDDAQVFLPILVSRHPELYYTRIAKGDTDWHHVLNSPWGQVTYMLMSKHQGALSDLVLARWYGAPDGKVSFLRPVYSVGDMSLVRVAPAEPPAPRGFASTG